MVSDQSQIPNFPNAENNLEMPGISQLIYFRKISVGLTLNLVEVSITFGFLKTEFRWNTLPVPLFSICVDDSIVLKK